MAIIDIHTGTGKGSVRQVVMRTALALLAAATIAPSAALAGETEAKAMLKAMTDYMAAQKELSFRYDASIEAVTKDGEKLQLANSGRVALARPDRIAATRSGGFADIETIFDGKTMTILGKTKNIYLQLPIPGSVDHLVDVLQNQYNRPLPAADLLLTNAYSELMTDVTEAKDLGSGVIGGIECDHLAFRGKDVDWQIWIAQGSPPLPVQIRDHLQTGRRLSCLHHPVWRLANRKCGRGWRLCLQGSRGCQADLAGGAESHKGHE